MGQEPWRWSAVDTAHAIATREVSAREVTLSVLDRIDAVNPRINALVEVLHDEALATAEAADVAVARGDPLGPLHGVPVTTKINVDQRGCHSSGGVAALCGLVAQEDCAVVANLRAAGAILLGRSNTPAFSMRWFTDNAAHGRTLNPWNAALTPGGSSGGAAAALAGGMGSIAHGNDLGGSIRYPAYACGVVGLRPTPGRVPSFNPTAQAERGIVAQLMTSHGPLAHSVADTRLAFEVMAANDARDPLWAPVPLAMTDAKRPCRVAVFTGAGLGAGVVAPEVVEAVQRAAQWLQAAGYAVEEAVPPEFQACGEIWRLLVQDDLRRAAASMEAAGDPAAVANLRLQLAWSPPLAPGAYQDLLARRLGLARAWNQFFETRPLLLMPTSFQLPFPIDDDIQSLARLQAITQAQGPLLAVAMLGLPGLSLPTGPVRGIPMGVQVCAARWREDLCLAAGEVIEAGAQAETFAPV